ncbi:MAG: glucosidase, partial [Actinobacteria bacterium]|nr:glucosidase [Actinomycetota bacterium]
RWSWAPGFAKPSLQAGAPRSDGSARLVLESDRLGTLVLVAGPGQHGATPEALVCDNETNTAKLWGSPGPKYPKDAISDHVVHKASSLNPAQTGTKASLRYHFEVAPGETVSVRLRFGRQSGDLGVGFDTVVAQRKAEADEYFKTLTPQGASAEEAKVLRQAAAGMLWCKQFYHYNVQRWLSGDPLEPPPPPERREGRNSGWAHVFNHEVISMPDSWEYPWYAAWDLAFHTIALAHLDPDYAKSQLLLLCREWYMHPNGQFPAYEWDFGDVNPPVQAWAAMTVWRIDATRRAKTGQPPDNDFLERMFHKLLINFTWWVNRKDAEGNNAFEGGFLGLDNIGLFDRSKPLPVPGVLEQSDGTAWMATYCISMLEMALRLSDTDPTYEDMAIKFYEHFGYIAAAVHDCGLWDDQDGFFYDVIHLADGTHVPVKARSMVGIVPLFAVTTLHPTLAAKLPGFSAHVQWFEERRPDLAAWVAHAQAPGSEGRRHISIVDEEGLRKVLHYVLSPEEMLSPHGVRSLSLYHRDHPFTLTFDGQTYSIDYEPAESTTTMFGGNSNWRGPVWFPLNFLLIEALHRHARYFGDTWRIECPTGSGNQLSLSEVARELSRRLVSLFLPGSDGRRPAHGDNPTIATDPAWRDLIWFHEYFHGDTGAGLGASHQTGWSGLVLHLIATGGGGVAS